MLAVTIAVKGAVFVAALPYAGNLPETYPDLEPYEDFTALYQKEVANFLSGQTPYLEFFHAYPPLFLYVQGTAIAITHLEWTRGLVFLLFDIFSVVPAFWIARRFFAPPWAAFVAWLAVLAPVNLFYNNVQWLNPPPMNFFMLFGVHFLVDRHYDRAGLALGIAAGFKQVAGALFPIMLLLAWRQGGRRAALYFTLLFAGMAGLISAPYLLTVPQSYLWSIGVPGIPTPPQYAPPVLEWKFTLSDPVNIVIPLGFVGLEEYWPPATLGLWGALIIGYAILLWRTYRREPFGPAMQLGAVLAAFLLFHALFPRGIYKYWFASILPLLAFFLASRRGVYLYLVLNVVILFAPRYLTPWLALILLTLVPDLVANPALSKPWEPSRADLGMADLEEPTGEGPPP